MLGYCKNCFNTDNFEFTLCDDNYQIFCIKCYTSYDSIENLGYSTPYEISKKEKLVQ